MIHELLSYERRSYLQYLSSQIQSTGPAIQTVKSILDGQMNRKETKSHLSSEKGGVPEGRMQRITPSDQRLYEYQFIGILCIYISYVTVCFNDTIKSLHFEQLLVNHINCKDITDYTQSYHSRKATRQSTHFYNSKGTVGGRVKLETTQRGEQNAMSTGTGPEARLGRKPIPVPGKLSLCKL